MYSAEFVSKAVFEKFKSPEEQNEKLFRFFAVSKGVYCTCVFQKHIIKSLLKTSTIKDFKGEAMYIVLNAPDFRV